jgi:hypothetical protein
MRRSRQARGTKQDQMRHSADDRADGKDISGNARTVETRSPRSARMSIPLFLLICKERSYRHGQPGSLAQTMGIRSIRAMQGTPFAIQGKG